ncbi:uncharacterized protein LOC143257355 isoform X2 [Tachypleus tridentatus]|uniref:uncharacterized protein LOC143257355 isoform X2 n=1 Tax=Tachypleus tridentatus TaxID=6853 RepID=UPI003FD002BF
MTSQEQPKLPSYNRVMKWTKNHVIKWLIREGLDDCVTSFQNRDIDGPALLEITEEKLITWFSDLRIKRRRLLGGLKIQETRNETGRNNTHVDASEEWESDGWDTDFNDEEEVADQVVYNPTMSTFSLTTIGSETTEPSTITKLQDESGNKTVISISLTNGVDCLGERKSNLVDSDVSGHSEPSSQVSNPDESSLSSIPDVNLGMLSLINKTHTPILSSKHKVPRPPEAPVSPKLFNSKLSSNSPNLKSVVSRKPPPYERPPNDPPPPPLPFCDPPLLSTLEDDEQEDYEIPICGIPVSGSAPPTIITVLGTHAGQVESVVATSQSQSSITLLSPVPGVTEDHEIQGDTYETIEKGGEENYEVVLENLSGSSSSLVSSSSDKPPNMKATTSDSPPPLPDKVKKYQDLQISHSIVDSHVDLDRPKLPRGKDNLKSAEEQSQTSVTGTISGLLSSVLANRSLRKTSRDQSSSSSSSSSGDSISVTGSHWSRAATPEKTEFVSTPQGPQLLLKTVTSVPFPKQNAQLFTEETGMNAASRPLPPVPAVPQDPRKDQDPLLQYPWYHDIERDNAEKLLQKQGGDGFYLVRPSRRAGQANPYTLTILYSGRIFHLNLRERQDGLYALGREKNREKTFSTVAELIGFHQKEPILLTTKGEPAGKICLNSTLSKLY